MNPQLPQDLSDTFADVDRDLEDLGKQYPAQLEAQATPHTIYHYTDENGFRGIIESGTLWCSDIFYLNDPSELRYGVDIAVDMMPAATAGGPPEAQIFSGDFRRYGASGAEDIAH